MFKGGRGRRAIIVGLGTVVVVAAALVVWLSGKDDHRQTSDRGWTLSTPVGQDGARLRHGEWSVIVRPGATGRLVMRPSDAGSSAQRALVRLEGDVGAVRAGGGVRVTLISGRLGAGGAVLIRRLAAPLTKGTRGTFAYFDPSLGLWRPIPTRISADRRTLTGVVHHFTALDTIYYGVSWVLGQRASKPECGRRLPGWVQPQGVEFFADKNAPLLWCAEADPSDDSRLRVKVAVNRGYGVAVQPALRPAVSKPPFGDTPVDLASRSYARLLH